MSAVCSNALGAAAARVCVAAPASAMTALAALAASGVPHIWAPLGPARSFVLTSSPAVAAGEALDAAATTSHESSSAAQWGLRSADAASTSTSTSGARYPQQHERRRHPWRPLVTPSSALSGLMHARTRSFSSASPAGAGSSAGLPRGGPGHVGHVGHAAAAATAAAAVVTPRQRPHMGSTTGPTSGDAGAHVGPAPAGRAGVVAAAGRGFQAALGAANRLRQPAAIIPPSHRTGAMAPPPPLTPAAAAAAAASAAAQAQAAAASTIATTAAAAAAAAAPAAAAGQQQQAVRQLSVQPEATVYAGPSPRNPARVTLRTIRKKYEQGEQLTMVTAYDYPSAVHVDAAGIDLLLVGDSVAMVVHGHDTTLPITLDEMLVHCKAAARGARRAFLVGDLPFGCYETDVRDAVRSAVRMLKEGGMDAVKLEGGSPARVEAARAIVETGVAVMGHVGLTPQSVSVIGGFRPQAQVAEEALRVLDQAQALQKAGCFALVLECIPGPIAAAITRSLAIPTIGIGAGGECSGQVLVYHDLLGMMSHPHHAKVTPKFCKQYAKVGETISAALQQYRQEVEERAFPGPRFSPYTISNTEVHSLAEALRKRGMAAAAQAVEEEAHRAAEAKAQLAAAAGGKAPPK